MNLLLAILLLWFSDDHHKDCLDRAIDSYVECLEARYKPEFCDNIIRMEIELCRIKEDEKDG